MTQKHLNPKYFILKACAESEPGKLLYCGTLLTIKSKIDSSIYADFLELHSIYANEILLWETFKDTTELLVYLNKNV
jgi:hypothetical protein